MSRLTDRLERDLREIAEGAHPSPSAWESITARLGDDDEQADVTLLPSRGAQTSNRRLWFAAAAAAVFVLAGAIAVRLLDAGDDESITIDDPAERPTRPPGTSGGWWPQTNPAEARVAQEGANAGDPAYTWQLDDNLAANEDPWEAEIFARFIEEELGWEAFVGASFAGYAYGDAGGDIDGVAFIRCAPGQTNPLSTLYVEAPPEIRTCAPTIDELTYETVRFNVHQPQRGGPAGIWLIDTWEILPSRPTLPGPLGTDFGGGRVEQAVPPTDADITAVLDAFLRARVNGEGAEQYLFAAPPHDEPVPLLYATSAGAPYERTEIERVRGPVWPDGWTEYEVRLFAADGTVVAQRFHVVRSDGQLGMQYGYADFDVLTTENGRPLAVPQSVFGDLVTATAPTPVPRGDGVFEVRTGSDGRVVIAADPPANPCESPFDFTARDAATLARDIAAVPAFEATEPVPVTVAGSEGLQLDVTFRDAACEQFLLRDLPAGDPGWRARLYLVDFPDAAGPGVLMVAVIASETSFEDVLEDAAPIVGSVAFRSG